MSAFIDENSQFIGVDGKPINNGKLYVGVQGLDPILNPEPIFSDRALTIPLSNPQILDSSGRSTNKIWIAGEYSFRVDNTNNVQKLIDLDAGAIQTTGTTILFDVQGSDTITATASPTITSYIDGQIYVLQPASVNTGATTLNIDSLGAKAVVGAGVPLTGDELLATLGYLVVFNQDNDNFDLIGSKPLADAEFKSISGLVPSNAADIDHDITISSGAAINSTGIEILKLTSNITKQIDATWAEGTNLGGLFSGTVAASTTYHLFIIEKDSDGSIDAGFDTSLTADNIPSGYTDFRRVYSLQTNGSSNFRAFNAVEISGGAIQTILNDRITDVSDTAPGTSSNTATLNVPADIEMMAHLNTVLQATVAVDIIITSTSETNVAPGAGLRDLRVVANSQVSTSDMERMTNTSGNIRYRSSLGSGLTVFRIVLLGWTDFRR